MAKATLRFNLEDLDDRHEFERMNKAGSMANALWTMAQEVFRPARKHGYPDTELQNLTDHEVEVISLLEKKFYEIMNDNEIDLDKLTN